MERMDNLDDQVVDSRLKAFRAETFLLKPGGQLRSVEDALDFVEARGFVTLWPIKGVDLPSLWTGVVGDRPLTSDHDDAGHITWGWKDAMLDQRRWYYGKLLRGKATLVSLSMLPYFYALSERVGDLDDYNLAYDDGKLTWEAKSVADAVFKSGPLNTIDLREKAHLSAASAKYRFDRALTVLQGGLWLLPVGISNAGAWHYSFIYELFERWYPDVLSHARKINRREAGAKLLGCYLASVGAAKFRKIQLLFGWTQDFLKEVLENLKVEDRVIEIEKDHWMTTAVLEAKG
jgi:hypothetical protein